MAPVALAADVADYPTYETVVLRQRVTDQEGRPQSAMTVSLTADLSGFRRLADGTTHPYVARIQRTAITDQNGVAEARIEGLEFLGTITQTSERKIFERPSQIIDGFPVWLGNDQKFDRPIVLVEGFDLYNSFSATDNMRLVSPAAKYLRAAGRDFLVVSFDNPYLPPDQNASVVARAIRAASAAAGGASVDVVGLSTGGLTARWALCTAESAGEPLPVRTLVTYDTPHRGAHLSIPLQMLVQRYAGPKIRRGLESELARSVAREYAVSATWKHVGLPGPLGRDVPETIQTSRSDFFDRLHALNANRGYPIKTRIVGVAVGSRNTPNPNTELLRIWMPGNYFWTEKADALDRAPGSLLPGAAASFQFVLPLGIGGAYFKGLATFIPTESALDAGPSETPPFDAFYARPDGLPPQPHDQLDPQAARFIVRELLRP